jgi:hypothetical protein
LKGSFRHSFATEGLFSKPIDREEFLGAVAKILKV